MSESDTNLNSNSNKGILMKEDGEQFLTQSLKEPEWLTSFKIELDRKSKELVRVEFPKQIDELTLLLSSNLFTQLGVGEEPRGQPTGPPDGSFLRIRQPFCSRL